MKKNEIKVGGRYTAKVSGRIVTVQVDAIDTARGYGPRSPDRTVYDVTNLITGRRITFRSAAKFRSCVHDPDRVSPPGPRTGGLTTAAAEVVKIVASLPTPK